MGQLTAFNNIPAELLHINIQLRGSLPSNLIESFLLFNPDGIHSLALVYIKQFLLVQLYWLGSQEFLHRL